MQNQTFSLVDNKLLGKPAKTPATQHSLAVFARQLGFSSQEIETLKRIYHPHMKGQYNDDE